MVGIVRVNAKIITDNSGQHHELPVLVMEDQALQPLLDYLLAQYHRRSIFWMNRVVHAVYLLLEYLEANKNLFDEPSILFLNFAQRLCSGTIGSNGDDPSGLYWLPRSTNTANQLLTSLNNFSDWLEINQRAKSLNPMVEATTHEERLNYAAWYQKNCRQFLGHIKHSSLPMNLKQVRKVQNKNPPFKVNNDAISFSEPLFKRFFIEGIGGSKDQRVAIRDQLIVLLMHGCGVRESDALHLWIQDVSMDRKNPNHAIVHLYHPELGRAPEDWKSRNGQTNRAAYLQEKYALVPRNRRTGTSRVGWKTKVVENHDNCIRLYWFPCFFAQLFYQLWMTYLRVIMPIKRDHPYAFISFSPDYTGKPLTLNAFNQNYNSSLYRIGLFPSKSEGHSPHSHRHAYGRRLMRAKVDPLIRKKALHHASIESQSVYVQPGITDVTEALDEATTELESGVTPKFSVHKTDWDELIKTGFEDIDPMQLYSGANPLFRK